MCKTSLRESKQLEHALPYLFNTSSLQRDQRNENGNEQATFHHVTEKNNQLTSNKQLKKSETVNVRLIFNLLVRKILNLSNIISK